MADYVHGYNRRLILTKHYTRMYKKPRKILKNQNLLNPFLIAPGINNPASHQTCHCCMNHIVTGTVCLWPIMKMRKFSPTAAVTASVNDTYYSTRDTQQKERDANQYADIGNCDFHRPYMRFTSLVTGCVVTVVCWLLLLHNNANDRYAPTMSHRMTSHS